MCMYCTVHTHSKEKCIFKLKVEWLLTWLAGAGAGAGASQVQVHPRSNRCLLACFLPWSCSCSSGKWSSTFPVSPTAGRTKTRWQWQWQWQWSDSDCDSDSDTDSQTFPRLQSSILWSKGERTKLTSLLFLFWLTDWLTDWLTRRLRRKNLRQNKQSIKRQKSNEEKWDKWSKPSAVKCWSEWMLKVKYCTWQSDFDLNLHLDLASYQWSLHCVDKWPWSSCNRCGNLAGDS